MTTDLRTQIRAYFDEIDPPFEPAELMAQPVADRIKDGLPGKLGWRRFPGWAYAAATAAIVLLLVAGSVWLSGFLGEETPPVITQPTTPPTTVTSERNDGPIAAPTSDFINQVEDLALAPDGTLWAATRGGVVEWPVGASSPVVYGEEGGLPAAVVDGIVVATDGTVWAAGNGWVAYLDKTWQSVEAEDPTSRTMVADRRGECGRPRRAAMAPRFSSISIATVRSKSVCPRRGWGGTASTSQSTPAVGSGRWSSLMPTLSSSMTQALGVS